MSQAAEQSYVNLPESLMLLATDDESGRISSQMRAADFGAAGAVLLELLFSGRIASADGKLQLLSDAGTGDPVLDNAVFLIGKSKKQQDAKHWVRKIADAGVKDQLLDRLTGRDILRRVPQRLLWVIPDDRYLIENPQPEEDIRASLRAVVLEDRNPDARSAALIALLKATDLTGAVFSKAERKTAKSRIDAIASGDLMSAAVSSLIKEMQAALMAAIVATTATTTVAATSN